MATYHTPHATLWLSPLGRLRVHLHGAAEPAPHAGHALRRAAQLAGGPSWPLRLVVLALAHEALALAARSTGHVAAAAADTAERLVEAGQALGLPAKLEADHAPWTGVEIQIAHSSVAVLGSTDHLQAAAEILAGHAAPTFRSLTGEQAAQLWGLAPEGERVH